MFQIGDKVKFREGMTKEPLVGMTAGELIGYIDAWDMWKVKFEGDSETYWIPSSELIEVESPKK